MHPTLPALASLLLALTALSGCDETAGDVSEEGVSPELRAQALEAATAAEAEGRPAQAAWDRAVSTLGPDVGSSWSRAGMD